MRRSLLGPQSRRYQRHKPKTSQYQTSAEHPPARRHKIDFRNCRSFRFCGYRSAVRIRAGNAFRPAADKTFYQNKHRYCPVCKGIEAETGKMLSEIAEDEIPAATIAILSGPGFAVDIAQRKLTSVTIACAKDGLAAQLTNMLATPYFRPYTTSDMISPQIGGSVKNVIAIGLRRY